MRLPSDHGEDDRTVEEINGQVLSDVIGERITNARGHVKMVMCGFRLCAWA